MKALIFWGGWDGHTPKETAELLEGELRRKGFEVEIASSLDCLKNGDRLAALDLVVPVWTCGQLPAECWTPLNAAIRAGVGFGGLHGGTGDAFRGQIDYEWLVGGLFVGHPYVGQYTITLTATHSPITAGMKRSFVYDSEQYYMLVDPGNTVLAETLYRHEGREVTMPVVWTKKWGRGRVFYSALGHTAKELAANPEVLAMTVRGLIWAAEGKSA